MRRRQDRPRSRTRERSSRSVSATSIERQRLTPLSTRTAERLGGQSRRSRRSISSAAAIKLISRARGASARPATVNPAGELPQRHGRHDGRVPRPSGYRSVPRHLPSANPLPRLSRVPDLPECAEEVAERRDTNCVFVPFCLNHDFAAQDGVGVVGNAVDATVPGSSGLPGVETNLFEQVLDERLKLLRRQLARTYAQLMADTRRRLHARLSARGHRAEGRCLRLAVLDHRFGRSHGARPADRLKGLQTYPACRSPY